MTNEIDSEVVVTTPHSDPDITVEATFEGDFAENLKLVLAEQGYGYYGHKFNIENYNNLDLYAAIAQLDEWDIQHVENRPLPSIKEDVIRDNN